MTTAIDRAREHSGRALEKLRAGLADIVPPDEVARNFAVPYARREASQESDLEFFRNNSEVSGAERYC